MLFVLVGLMLGITVVPGGATEIGAYAFQRTWATSDRPVADQQVARTWLWGPSAMTGVMLEPYDEGLAAEQVGTRLVQYFDKARMEINDPAADSAAPGFVTTGLLAKELITGRLQLGDERFAQYAPASINVVGDLADPSAPTYATLTPLQSYAPLPRGWAVTQTLDRAGNVGDDAQLADYGVFASVLVEQTGHTVASVFWDFVTGSTTIYDGWRYANAPISPDPFGVIGLPLTEPYWVTTTVGGRSTLVLLQAFERRVLTYTPSNPDGWNVESANVGLHYYQWRYGGDPASAVTTVNVGPHRDAAGDWVFLGEAESRALAPLDNVQITVDLYDASGAVVASQAGYLDVTTLQYGERVPFRVWFDTDVAFTRFEVRAHATPSPVDRPRALTLVAKDVTSTPGTYTVSGTVRNDGGEPVEGAVFVVALYDADGRLVDYDWGFVTPDRLEAGATGTLSLTFPLPDTAVDTVRVLFGE